MYPAMPFRKFWEHQTRWARTVRLCRPGSYMGLLFTHGLPWAIAGAIASRSAIDAAAFISAYMVLRLSLAWTVGVWGLQDETARWKWRLVPFRDAIHFAVWVGSFFSNRITWGDVEFRLRANGEMAAIASSGVEKSTEKPVQAG
jgi:ceramide glucosyltransferase